MTDLDNLRSALLAFLQDDSIDLETKKETLESLQTEFDTHISELEEMIESADEDEHEDDDDEEGKEKA